ncbi:MAG: glycine--tRNA ligase subunit beta [Gammaproteobacteria bacterium]|nr:glycine--tRNA ligase subunit beta [Gammaproteobacteria bacterium]
MQQKDGKLFFSATESGKPAADLIQAAVNEALANLPIPKRMRWGDASAEFVRPIHWAVVLFGTDVIDCEILGVQSGRHTRGHRYHHPEPIKLESAADYADALYQARVWLNDVEQQLNQRISEEVAILAEQVNGYALNSEPDSELVAEVAALVEWPVPLRGQFDQKFLELPEEVLIATLEDQQRYFPIREEGTDKLLPYFITVANIESRDPDQVRAGNERVIVPRLSDAMFFWETDRSQPLADRIAALDGITFQKKLGSLGDKMRRVAALAAEIAAATGGSSDRAERAAQLAKCDLLSQLVGEFPELQGTAGAYLASHDGEDAEVARAIGEHYRPRFAGDALPQTATGRALAVADRLDTLVGIFAIGQAPTGEKDPFALRRAALGALRIMIECELDLDLKDSLQQAAGRFPQTVGAGNSIDTVFDFMMERLRRHYLDSGIGSNIFEAVLACKPTRPLDFHRRLLAVQAFRRLAEAESLAAANKRISNILKQAGSVNGSLQPELLQDPAEKQLASDLEALRARVEPLLANNQYEQALTALAGLRDSVDAFFDNVMVMCDDDSLRNNRIALLSSLSDLFRRTADISRLQ